MFRRPPPGLLGGGQRPTAAAGEVDSGHLRQAAQAEDSFDQRVVAVGAAVAQFAEAQKQTDDELEEEGGRPEDLTCGAAAEARPQSGGEIQPDEELLEEDQSREGGERREGMGLTVDIGSAKLQLVDLSVVCIC